MCDYKILPELKTAILRQSLDERERVKDMTGELLKEGEDYETLYGTPDCKEAITTKLRCVMFFYIIENNEIKHYDGSISLVKIHDYYSALEIKNLLKL